MKKYFRRVRKVWKWHSDMTLLKYLLFYHRRRDTVLKQITPNLTVNTSILTATTMGVELERFPLTSCQVSFLLLSKYSALFQMTSDDGWKKSVFNSTPFVFAEDADANCQIYVVCLKSLLKSWSCQYVHVKYLDLMQWLLCASFILVLYPTCSTNRCNASQVDARYAGSSATSVGVSTSRF